MKDILTGWLLCASIASAMTSEAHAQEDYPSRLVRIVVPVAPGGAPDVLARGIAEKLSSKWGKQVIVENRPGAALNIGAESVASAPPDGYTLLLTPPGPLVTNQHLYPALKYNPADFVPITIIAEVPFVLVSGPNVNVTDLSQFIALAKAHPGGLRYPSPGVGSPPHLIGALFSARAGVSLGHVPYKGLAPALNELLGGHIDVMFFELGSTLPYIRSGRLKALAVGSQQRLPQLPEVPTFGEMLPGFVATTWFAVVAPPHTPPDIARKLSQAISEQLRLPDVEARLRGLSATPVGGTPAETVVFLKREAERWQKVIRDAAIKPE